MFEQLKKDATPQAETIKAIASNVVNSKAVKISQNLGYKVLVNTIGVPLVLTEPAISKAKQLLVRAAGLVKTQVEALAKQQLSSEVKK
jgi:hypothetical protein